MSIGKLFDRASNRINMEYPEFPSDAGYTSIRDVLSGKSGKSVKIRGWVYRTRSSGKLAFVVVRDSTGVIQCTVSRDKVAESDFDGASKALIESSVILEGKPVKDARAPGGWEIRATKFEVFHFAETFPITKDQSDEHLLNNRHLWLRSRKMVSALKIRSTVFKAFRDYWTNLDFTEIQSPSFTTSACEGGSTLFNVSYDDENEKSGQKFYAHLSQSWQLYAEATMFGLENIFTLAPSFRAEKSRTRSCIEFLCSTSNDLENYPMPMLLPCLASPSPSFFDPITSSSNTQYDQTIWTSWKSKVEKIPSSSCPTG